MVQRIHGRFERWGGSLFFDRAQPSQSSLELWVDLASITTGDDERDAHVRSAEFLDVTRFPRAKFSSGLVEVRGSDVIVNGRLELHGVVHDVQVNVEIGAPPPAATAACARTRRRAPPSTGSRSDCTGTRISTSAGLSSATTSNPRDRRAGAQRRPELDVRRLNATGTRLCRAQSGDYDSAVPAMTRSDAAGRLGAELGLVLATALAAVSLFGIILPSTYARETTAWAAQAIGQDWFDLVVAVPWLAVTARWAERGDASGRLVFAGSVLYGAFTSWSSTPSACISTSSSFCTAGRWASPC